jgi:7,8-dihydropterin-6-yl-methyl-4-(beta-D-ribofuranosyl)aminobenzene 5'-phosphate synthase
VQAVCPAPLDSLEVTILADNLFDGLLVDEGPARRPRFDPDLLAAPSRFMEGGRVFELPLAQHGFGALVTAQVGDRDRRVVFDTGATTGGFVENARRLGLSVGDVEAIVLSHGHPDHTAGMEGLANSLGASAGLPVLIHPDFWSRRRLRFPESEPEELPATSRKAVEEAGFEILEERRPSLLLDGTLLVTGEVARTTSFERGMPGHEALKDGRWVPDPLILDDQAVVAQVRDKGLVVLTGCGHSGIVNIVRYARKITGMEKVHAIIGGFHLNGPAFEPMIPQTVAALAAFEPDVLVPTHCTGFEAIHALADRMPAAFYQGSVGTTFVLKV